MSDIEGYKAFASHVLTVATAQLLEHGQCMAAAHMLTPDATFVFVLGPDILNDEKAKYRCGEMLHAKAAELKPLAVCFVTDTFFHEGTRDAKEMLQQLRITIEQAGAVGLIKVREAVMCTLETPIYSQIERQVYRKDDKGKITLEERVLDDSDMHLGRGRFSGFFESQTTTAQ